MNDEQLAAAVASDPNMSLYMYKASSQFELFCEARELYYSKVEQLKAKVKDIPVDLLIEISENYKMIKKTDPDLVPEKKISLADAAEREIHRRAFLAFTAIASRNEKMDAFRLGFLRKPKF